MNDTEQQATPVEQAAATPPAWLCEAGRGYWADLARYLPGGAIRAADAHAYALLCNELDTYARADKAVQDDGVLVDLLGGKDGTLTMGSVPNPALKVRNDAGANIAKWSAYLQLTPADRATRAGGQRTGKLRHRHE